MTTTTLPNGLVNGVNVAALHKLLADVQQDHARGHTEWGVTTRWDGGTQSETQVNGFSLGGRRINRNFRFHTDEPLEVGGTNEYPNPQEYLMGALNACMVVGYVGLSTLFGITLESLEIETKGEIDLRGFLGVDPTVKPGYDEIHYTVRIKGNGTEEQFREIHQMVIKTSPNYFNVSQPVKLTSELVVE